MVYSCKQYKYKATQQTSLKEHKQNIHEGVKYSCKECECKTGDKLGCIFVAIVILLK